MTRRVAIVTYNWPPRNAIGTHRPYSWARYMSTAGFEVTVITAKKQAFDEPLNLGLPDIPGARVIEIENHSISSSAPFSSALGKLKIPLRQMRKWLQSHMGVVMDARDWWSSAAIPIATKMASDFDIVISTFGPRSSHLVGAAMKAANPEVFWVADYRDLWSMNHLSLLGPRALRNEIILERKTVNGKHPADLLTTVSEELRETLVRTFELHSEVIYNGFEQGDRVEFTPRSWSGKKILYTGMLYEGSRDPSLLFKAIRTLADEDLLKIGDLSIDFYGPRNKWLENLVNTWRVSDFVRIFPAVPREEALGLQASADALLLLESPSPAAAGVLTGKLFEYLGASKPIISLGSQQDSAIARVLEQCGAGTCVGTDEAACYRILKDFIESRLDWYGPDKVQIKQYSREVQANKLIELVERGQIKKREG